MHRRWLVNRTNQEFLEYLSRKASISTPFAQILVNRGFKDHALIKDFLSPSFEKLFDPFLLPDMEAAVQRIKLAISKEETVLVHGDYDTDGVTSTTVMVSALRRLGLNTRFHIPNRIKEGYGLSQSGIKKAEEFKAGLIITVDCGISSYNEVIEARQIGIDVIITDHHEPPEALPPAVAVINPHRRDSVYPFKYLAGVGVAFKLVQALFQNTEHRIQNTDLLDLVAIGTVADSQPLLGENRILVACGLKNLNKPDCRTGIQAMKQASGISNKEIKSGMLSYTIIPRINAAGRIGDAGEVVELFLTHDEARAKGIAAFLDDQNKKRQAIEAEVFNAAIKMIDKKNIDRAIVLHSPAWHQGVIGIVASRLVEEFYRPAFLFSVVKTDKGAVAKGSARSIPPFHIYNAISECKDLLLGFGGHSQAAGLRLLETNMPEFKKQINMVAERELTEEALTPMLQIDAAVELFDVTLGLTKELSLLEPFGNSNEEPLIGVRKVQVSEHRIVGNNHLKMRLKQKNMNIDTIGFSMGNLLEGNGSPSSILSSQLLDAVFVPCINEWNGNKYLQLNLKALRPSNGD
ncbi:MAG: single-stranded-DNA-specific exonuclease RecJ [Nitrospirae bacterium]|nr:single-stranded-DNA-specific exonuclease RecJ [Nitrospirota bacterium]